MSFPTVMYALCGLWMFWQNESIDQCHWPIQGVHSKLARAHQILLEAILILAITWGYFNVYGSVANYDRPFKKSKDIGQFNCFLICLVFNNKYMQWITSISEASVHSITAMIPKHAQENPVTRTDGIKNRIQMKLVFALTVIQ